MSHTTSVSPPPSLAPAARPPAGRLRRILMYGASRGVTEGLVGVRGLVLAGLLGPSAFGVWALFRLGLKYAALATIGVHRGLELEVAQSRAGAADVTSHGEEFGRTALGFTLVSCGALAVAALVASFWVANPPLVLAMRGFAAAVVVDRVWFYAATYQRAEGNLRRFATLEMVSAALHLGLTVALALVWGLGGAFVGFSVASAISAVLLIRDAPYRPELDLEQLRRMLRVGVPLALSMMMTTALATVDQLVVAALAGTTVLGYYAFAVAVRMLGVTFAWVIRTVIFPEVYGRAKTAGSGSAIREHLDHTVRPFARFYPPLLGAAALGIGPAVMLVAPGYAPAIVPAQIFIFTGVTAGFAGLGSLAIVAADRQRTLPWLSAGALVLNLAFSILALRFGAGIEGVAAGALISQIVFGSAVLALVAHEGGIARPARFIFESLLPLGYCMAVIAGLTRWLPGTDLTSFLLALVLYLLLLLPLVPMMWREVCRLRGGG